MTSGWDPAFHPDAPRTPAEIINLGDLFYPAFDTEAHPALLRSLKISLRTLQLDCYDYATVDNPPILHRKESFLPEDYPGYPMFAELTRWRSRPAF